MKRALHDIARLLREFDEEYGQGQALGELRFGLIILVIMWLLVPPFVEAAMGVLEP